MNKLTRLSARLDNLIEFARGDQILKVWPNAVMARNGGNRLEAIIRKNPSLLSGQLKSPELIDDFIEHERKWMVPKVKQLKKVKAQMAAIKKWPRLSARFDNLVEFARGDQVLKLMPKMTLPREYGSTLEAIIRKKPSLLYPGDPGDLSPDNLAKLSNALITPNRKILAPVVNKMRKIQHLQRKRGQKLW